MSALMSIVEFCGKLAEITESIEEVKHEALEKAAKIVEKEAKREIGHYQDGGGMFPPWAELADSTKDDRVRLGFSENDPGLRSGDMRDSIEHEVHGDEAVVGSNADELVYFELGTQHQPPRSVLGLAAERKAPEVAEILGESAVMSLVGPGVFRGALPIPKP